ncbi:MAG TPA: hypothetical protein DD979_13335 [Gammaproteobacteria bacterium]|nr:hypothetical protein [Gammaproteobacteria bacterium]
MLYLANNVATFWFDCPGVLNLFGHYGVLGLESDNSDYSGAQLACGWLQLLSYIASAVWVYRYVSRRNHPAGLHRDAARYAWLAAYIVRAAFWAVVLVGLADVVVSFLRVEELLAGIVGDKLTSDLGRPSFRGLYVHYPLIVVAGIIAFFTRGLSVVWLAVLVVFAEFQIVISRFVFSYEQAFMGDLVRFWYAALFLFASAYALVDEGHVRVDVLYAHFGRRAKAWTNAVGTLLLGLPICFTILLLGLWGRGSSLNSPLLSYEISQSGFGMYVKYLMAGFLVVFALSMIVQFAAYFLESVAVLLGDDDDDVNDAAAEQMPHSG